MSTSVTLDRELYHMQHEIYDWCSEQFGPSSLFEKDALWKMSLMFGHQTYTFKDKNDAAMFAVKWGGIVGND